MDVVRVILYGLALLLFVLAAFQAETNRPGRWASTHWGWLGLVCVALVWFIDAIRALD